MLLWRRRAMREPEVMIVVMDGALRHALARLLRPEGYVVYEAATPDAAIALLHDGSVTGTLIVNHDSLALLDWLRDRGSRSPLVVIADPDEPLPLPVTEICPPPLDLFRLIDVVAAASRGVISEV
jgi:hypothetical protein